MFMLSVANADAFTNSSSDDESGGAAIVIVYFNFMKDKGNFVPVLIESCGLYGLYGLWFLKTKNSSYGPYIS
jgi:hypothetical protein